MAVLTTKKRKKLRKSQFADTVNRKYPIHDASHARNALARAAQALKAGRISRSKYNEIVARARAALTRFNKDKK